MEPGWETHGFLDKKGLRRKRRRQEETEQEGACSLRQTLEKLPGIQDSIRQRDNFQGVDSESCEDWRSWWGEAVQQTFPGAGPIRSPEWCWPVLGNLWAVDRAHPWKWFSQQEGGLAYKQPATGGRRG